MKYAVITPQKLNDLRKEGKLAQNNRFENALNAGFSGAFSEDYKDGMPFVIETLVDETVITDTTETPDLKAVHTDQRVNLEEEYTFKEVGEDEVRYVKMVKAVIEAENDSVEIKAEGNADNTKAMKEEIVHAASREARKKHFEDLQEPGKIPFLMKA